MIRRRIATDIDDFKAPFNHHFLKYWNSQQKTNYSLRDIKNYDYTKIFQSSEALVSTALYDFCLTKEFRSIQPHLPVKKLISSLHEQGHKFFIITSRTNEIAEFTHWWIQHHFTGIFSKEDIYFTNTYTSKGVNNSTKKVDICRKEGIEIIFDDCLDVCLECASAGIWTFMPPRPWNRNIPENPPSHFIPIRTIKEVLSHPLFT